MFGVHKQKTNIFRYHATKFVKILILGFGFNERTKESFWYFSCFMTQPYSQIVIGAGLIFFVPNVPLSNFVTGSLHCFVSVLFLCVSFYELIFTEKST